MSQVEILGLAPEAWSGPIKLQGDIYWNNAEVRTSTSIVLLKAYYEITNYSVLDNESHNMPLSGTIEVLVLASALFVGGVWAQDYQTLSS